MRSYIPTFLQIHFLFKHISYIFLYKSTLCSLFWNSWRMMHGCRIVGRCRKCQKMNKNAGNGQVGEFVLQSTPFCRFVGTIFALNNKINA